MDSIRNTYVEHRSKNYSGGVSDLTDGKAVTIIVHSQGNRSHTILLDLYLSKIPGEARQATNRFYLKPCRSHPLVFDHGLGFSSWNKTTPNYGQGYDGGGQDSRQFY